VKCTPSYEGELTDDLKKEIEDEVNKRMEEDDSVKTLVGEMANFTDDDDNRGGSTGGTRLGGRSRTGEDRGRNGGGEDKSVVSRTDNLTVRKVKIGG
jgi:hypothetical protein